MKIRFSLSPGPGKRQSDICVALVNARSPVRIPGTSRLETIARAGARDLNFTGQAGSIALWPVAGDLPARNLMLVGLGDRRQHTPSAFKYAGAVAARRLSRLTLSRIRILWPADALQPDALEAFAIGFLRGAYEFRAYRKPGAARPVRLQVEINGIRGRKMSAALASGVEIGESLNWAADVANHGGNASNPPAIIAAARKLARDTGMRCTVWDANRLRRERCLAHLGVGQGSRQPPCLIRLDYRPRKSARDLVTLVGKTITFDSGGLSLKPAKSMESMKFDKCGGMAVLAAMRAIARLRLPRAVTGFLAVAENMPGGDAQRPGDVVRTRKGLTVEVLNTDAEGRLVLADALHVACDLKPAALIDFATLTGAAVTALGKERSALMGTNDALLQALIRSGEQCGEKLWVLPRDAEYRELIRTPVADLRNIGDGTAGTIVGGIFLEQFVDTRVPWAHIDLTHAWEERDRPHAAAGATLFGAHLVVDWLKRGNKS